MKIGVIGYGVVGQAIHQVFKEKGDEVKWKDRIDGTPLPELCEWAEYIFLSLPTPTDFENEKYDLSIFDKVISEIVPYVENTEKLVVIKSTVVPGTTVKYQAMYPKVRFIFNPEFLTAATPVEDFRTQDRIVLGVPENVNPVDIRVYNHLIHFYISRFPKASMFTVGFTEAEMIKYMGNIFLSTKVIFANEMAELCNKLGANYHLVSSVVGMDQRIGPSHLKVTEKKGFSGMCFPKDIIALINRGEEVGADMTLTKTVWEKNKKIRTVKDWGQK